MKPIDQVRQSLKESAARADMTNMEQRQRARAAAEAFALPAGVHTENGKLGNVDIEWVIPEDADAHRVFLHFHGGGYVLGSPALSRPITTEFAKQTRCRVASVDYALAPEQPFPAAVRDATDAYRGLIRTGYGAGSIAIGGEAAGGGLAVAMLIAARDFMLPMPSSLVALSPWADMRCTARSFSTNAALDPVHTAGALKKMASAYLNGGNHRAPLASPALADLSGLPPMLIQVGSDEVLLDDSRMLQRRAANAGVAAQIEIWPEMVHVWHMFHPMLPEGAYAISRLATFVQQHWHAQD